MPRPSKPQCIDALSILAASTTFLCLLDDDTRQRIADALPDRAIDHLDARFTALLAPGQGAIESIADLFAEIRNELDGDDSALVRFTARNQIQACDALGWDAIDIRVAAVLYSSQLKSRADLLERWESTYTDYLRGG